MNAISQHPLSPLASAADRSSASKLRKFRELFDSCDPDRTEPSNPVITSPTLAVPSPEPKHMKYKELFENADPDRSNNALPTHTHTLQVPDMSAEILRIACMRGDLSDLQERILHAATLSGQKTTATTTVINNDTVLRLLYACLRTLGVDFTPALAALESTQVHRCTRCSTSFRPADNTPTACAVPHAPPLVSWDLEVVADGVEPCETRYYTCCGRCVVVFPDQPEEDTHPGMCYVGPHEAPIHDVKPENVSRSEHKVGARGEYERDALAGKTHLQARPTPSPPSVLGQGHGHGHAPGTYVYRPVLGLGLQVAEGRSVPSTSRTAAWVNHTAGQLAAAQHQQQQQQHRQLLGRGRPPISRTTSLMDPGEWMAMGQREAATAPMTPWRQSSLYHPPGWVTIPPRLRGLAGDSPFA